MKAAVDVAIPEAAQALRCRHRAWAVASIEASQLPTDPLAQRYRQIAGHVESDHGACDACRASDLTLGHRRWATQQGMQFTAGPVAKDGLLDRLLGLTRQRYSEQVAAHPRRVKRSKGVKRAASKQGSPAIG